MAESFWGRHVLCHLALPLPLLLLFAVPNIVVCWMSFSVFCSLFSVLCCLLLSGFGFWLKWLCPLFFIFTALAVQLWIFQFCAILAGRLRPRGIPGMVASCQLVVGSCCCFFPDCCCWCRHCRWFYCCCCCCIYCC